METNWDVILRPLVAKFRQRNHASFRSHLNNLDEDLMMEARIAAHKAIMAYRADKQTKLTTWIYTCVNKRLLSLHEYESTKPLYHDSEELPEIAVNDLDQLEHDLTMRSILTKAEYELYRLLFVEGYSQRELIEDGIMKERELRCLYPHILRKSKSLVENLTQNLTLKKRTKS